MKHVNDLNQLLIDFSASNFYSVSVQYKQGSNCVCIVFLEPFPATTAALIIGDALHNLRSALDLLYYRTFHDVTGRADRHTHLPIRKTREKLISAIDGGLKKKELTEDVGAIKLRNFIVDIVKPYETGNWPMWALHDMNITDKHQLLIPVFKVMQFTGIRLEDEHGNVFVADRQPYFTEDSCWFPLGREGKFTVRDKGHAATAIIFGVEVPLRDKPVIPSLTQLAESVTCMIDTFEVSGLRALFD